MAPSAEVVRALTTQQVCGLARVAPATLDYWVKTDVVRPSYVGGEGKRYPRYWSVADAVAVRAVKALRDAGCPLQRVRRAQKVLRRVAGDGDHDRVLYWDGGDVLSLSEWGDVESMLCHPGQLVLHLVALPVDRWARPAAKAAKPVNLADLRERRDERRRNQVGAEATVRLRATGVRSAVGRRRT